ncbi:virulence factor TspB C-terminal domain-related protein [Stutzerimonas kirkiae]|uniref:virulence factor TspB C-terminal domain-related protein n=1 Tax=Stutzerimonas kirkiae TaxID=2211392 RepID=UPI001F609797|nr:virulence factor TspB C-terminal domain-related protein [Stutzerimonas kirkiae]
MRFIFFVLVALYPVLSFSNERPVFIYALPGQSFVSFESACESAISGIISYNNSVTTRDDYLLISLSLYSSANGSCRYSYVRADGVSGTSGGSSSSGPASAYYGSSCVSGSSLSLSYPLYRTNVLTGSFQQFGTPGRVCSSGCYADVVGAFGSESIEDDPINSGYSIAWGDVEYQRTGEACAGPAEPDKPIPGLPDDGSGDGDGSDDGGGDDSGGGTVGGNDGSDGDDTGGGDSGTGGGGNDSGDGGDGGDGGGGDKCTGDNSCNDNDTDDGPGDSSAYGMACDSTLMCEGDAIQCAILQQQKAARCEAQDLFDLDKHRGAIESFLDDDRFKPGDVAEGDSIQIPDFISNNTRFLPSSCPPPIALNLSGRSLSFSYEPLCYIANLLSPLIVILATVAAAMYVGRSFGGN